MQTTNNTRPTVHSSPLLDFLAHRIDPSSAAALRARSRIALRPCSRDRAAESLYICLSTIRPFAITSVTL